MAAEIERFAFPATGQPVRTVTVDGQPWFVAKDACEVLGISKYRDALGQLDADERASMAVDTPGGRQYMVVVSEPGIFSLMMISRSPRVKAFQRWITHDVLPAIRRTGSYGVAAAALPQDYEEALEQLLAKVRDNRALVAENAELKPSAEAWDVLASADPDWSVREAAFILNRDPGIDTGQTRLFNELRRMKVIDSRDIPYASHARHVRLRPRTYTNRATSEEVQAKAQVRITAEGLTYLHRRMGGSEPLELREPVS